MITRETKRPAVLINAANLRVGGAVQVAASFLEELAQAGRAGAPILNQFPGAEVDIRVSEMVVSNLSGSAREILPISTQSRTGRRRLGISPMVSYDVAFHLFGPIYRPARARRTIMGFADGTSLHPGTIAPLLGVTHRAKFALRRRVARRIFERADQIVVEAPSVARELCKSWNFDESRIHVVANTLHNVFIDSPPRVGTGVTFSPENKTITIGYPTRPYPHKNIERLGEAAQILFRKHGWQITILLTVTAEEHEKYPPHLRAVFRPVGTLTVAELPGFYERCDLIAFPSLLESFSATPLEAIACGIPLVASDREFVREVVGSAATYFEPTDPASIANSIRTAVGNSDSTTSKVRRGLEIARGWPSAGDRTDGYRRLIERELAGLGFENE